MWEMEKGGFSVMKRMNNLTKMKMKMKLKITASMITKIRLHFASFL